MLKDCAEALKVNPRSSKAYYRSAAALVALERYEEALDCCDRCLASDKENAPVKSLREKAQDLKDKKDKKDREKEEKIRREKEEKARLAVAFKVRCFPVSQKACFQSHCTSSNGTSLSQTVPKEPQITIMHQNSTLRTPHSALFSCLYSSCILNTPSQISLQSSKRIHHSRPTYPQCSHRKHRLLIGINTGST